MTNKEVFENYGTEDWIMREVLCYLLMRHKDELAKHPEVNPVGVVQEFLAEETLVNLKYAEMSKMRTLESKVIIDAE